MSQKRTTKANVSLKDLKTAAQRAKGTELVELLAKFPPEELTPEDVAELLEIAIERDHVLNAKALMAYWTAYLPLSPGAQIVGNLEIAAARGNYEMIKAVLENRIFEPPSFPLVFDAAVRAGQAGIINFVYTLVEDDPHAPPLWESLDVNEVFRSATESGSADAIRYLLDLDIVIEGLKRIRSRKPSYQNLWISSDPQTPIEFLIDRHRLKALKILLKAPTTLEPEKNRALLKARTPGLAKLLIRHGADPGARDSHGRNLLHQAALSGNTALAEFYLNFDLDPEERDRSNDSALLAAYRTKNLQLMELLQKAGYFPQDAYLERVAETARSERDTRMLEWLARSREKA